MHRRFSSLSIAVLVIGAIATSGAPASAEMLHLQIDTAATKISTSVMEPLSQVWGEKATPVEGTFKVMQGEVDGDPANPAKTGHVHLLIDPTTYDSGLQHRDRKVLSSVLETGSNSSIVFDSTRLENMTADPSGTTGTATVVGNLTLHSTTREIRVPVRLTVTPERTLYADGEVTFNYTDWGVKRAKLAFLIPAGDEVTVTFHVVAAPPPSASPSPSPTPG